jgi:hypothetical protein
MLTDQIRTKKESIITMDETERPGTIFSVLSSGTSVDSERLPGEMVETLSNVPGDNDDNDARSRRR